MGCQTLLILIAVLLFSCNGQYSREQILKISSKARKLPNLDECGLSGSTFETKIINGKEAKLGEFPWMANLGFLKEKEQGILWLCGGSLITNRYILTAAHCIDPRVNQRQKIVLSVVRLGELDLNDTAPDNADPVDYEVEKFDIHEAFNYGLRLNDIALIRTKTEIEFTAFIRPICLPPAEFQTKDFTGFHPYIAGWGKSVDSLTKPGTKLLQAEVEIQDTDECKKNYTRVMKDIVIDKRVLCASSEGKDSCQGDSGGPLMIFRKINPAASNQNMFVMGIVSNGYGCAVEGYPGIYTRVVEHVPWIIDKLDI